MSKAKKKEQSKPKYVYDKFDNTLVFKDGWLEVEIERESCCHSMYGCFDLSAEETRKLYEVMKEYYE